MANSSPMKNEPYRETALALMERYGYEETRVQGPSEDGFIFIKQPTNDDPMGFDGWEAIKDYFEEVDGLAATYTREQLQDRLDGDYTVIEYGVASEQQLRLAIANQGKTQEVQKSIFSLRMQGEQRFYENTSGLDVDALCKAYAECERPFVEMGQYGKRISEADFAHAQQGDDLTFSVEFDADKDEITISDGEHFNTKGLTETLFPQKAGPEAPHREEGGEKDAPVDAGAEKSLEEQRSEALYKGIASVMDSKDFKIYCDSINKLMYNQYSAQNCSKILMQWVQRYCDAKKINVTNLSPKEVGETITEALKSENAPSYLMGYEAWKKYGRQVTGKGVAYSITAPNFINENGGKGSLLKEIKKDFSNQFAADGSLEYARHQLGKTGISFHGYKNGLMDICMNGTVVRGKQTEETVRRFLDSEVIGKIPNGYTSTYVYDVKNTVEPEYLWVRNGYTKDELALDGKGDPIVRKPYKNANIIEHKIINTEERKGRFNPHIQQEIKPLDEQKMNALFEVLQEVSRGKGVPMSVEPIEEKGTDGFFSQKDNRIVISDALSATEKCAVAFHEMAHADMHHHRSDIPREMKEVQAEAVAYMTAQNFGIETSTSSFNYIAVWSKGRDVKELETSMNDILGQSKKLFKEISAELERKGLSRSIEPIGREAAGKAVTRDTKQFIRNNKDFVLEETTAANELKESAKGLLKSSSDERCSNILKEQVNLCNKTVRKLNALDKTLNELEGTTDPQSVEVLMAKAEKAHGQVVELKEKFTALSEEYVDRIQEMKVLGNMTVKERYEANPVETMKEFIRDSGDERMKALTDRDLDYIAKSKYVSDNFRRDMKSDMTDFMNQAASRAAMANQVKAKNGAFVEVSLCEQWGDEPIFVDGTLAHPKTANKIIEEAEKDVRSKKMEAEKEGGYFPYSKCYVTLYTEQGDGLMATSTRIDIGDGFQKNLSDHLKQCCHNGSVLEAYSKAVKERTKDKVVEPQDARIPDNVQKEVLKDKDTMAMGTMGSLKENIDLVRGSQAAGGQPDHDRVQAALKERTVERA